MLDLSLELKTVEVKLGGKTCTLVELDGTQRDKYSTDLGKRIVFVEGKAQGFKNFEKLQTSLLKLCLKDDGGTLIPEATLLSYPSSVLATLFKEAQKLNGLDELEGKNG